MTAMKRELIELRNFMGIQIRATKKEVGNLNGN